MVRLTIYSSQILHGLKYFCIGFNVFMILNSFINEMNFTNKNHICLEVNSFMYRPAGCFGNRFEVIMIFLVILQLCTWTELITAFITGKSLLRCQLWLRCCFYLLLRSLLTKKNTKWQRNKYWKYILIFSSNRPCWNDKLSSP